MNERPVILFDGVCHLCNGWVQFVLRRDSGAVFDFASLQSEFAQGRFSLESVVLLEAGQVYSGVHAVLRILARLTWPWPLLSRIAGLLPRGLLAWVYRLVARHRYRWFGKYESCMLPPAGSAGRFL
ncbi:MAG: DCC1-like thiol-disulfide oxidoreductase family protein [Candidatus Solibacter sp.]